MALYRVMVTFAWEVESDQDENQIMETALGRFPPQTDLPNLKVLSRLDKLKERPQKLCLGEFRPEDVIPFITTTDAKREYIVNGLTYQVRMNSHRYFIFRESLDCAACGLRGTKMLLEQHPADKSPHFNLYAEEEGRLILMTKDHIQAKAFGGEDRHSNYQTMCVICNNLKGSANIPLEGIRELRELYNGNFNKLPRRQFFLMLQEAKAKVSLPRSPQDKKISGRQRHVVAADRKSKEPVVVASGDIAVWREESGLVGRSIYESGEGQHVACIKKGTELTPVGSVGRRVLVQLSDGQECMVSEGLLDYRENEHAA